MEKDVMLIQNDQYDFLISACEDIAQQQLEKVSQINSCLTCEYFECNEVVVPLRFEKKSSSDSHENNCLIVERQATIKGTCRRFPRHERIKFWSRVTLPHVCGEFSDDTWDDESRVELWRDLAIYEGPNRPVVDAMGIVKPKEKDTYWIEVMDEDFEENGFYLEQCIVIDDLAIEEEEEEEE